MGSGKRCGRKPGRSRLETLLLGLTIEERYLFLAAYATRYAAKHPRKRG